MKRPPLRRGLQRLRAARDSRAWEVILPANYRRAAAAVLIAAGTPLFATILVPHRDPSVAVLVCLFGVAACAVVGRALIGLAAAIGSGLVIDYYFLEPLDVLAPREWDEWVVFIGFLVGSILLSVMVGFLQERNRSLRAAGEEYRDLVESLPLVTYTSIREGGGPHLRFSPQIEGLTGHSLEEWDAGWDLLRRLLHPDDLARVEAEVTATVERTENFSSEYRLIARDGRVVWILDEGAPFLDREGLPVGLRGFLLDITKRKTAQESLSRAEERYRTLVEQLPLVTYIGSLDPGEPPRYVGPQIEGLLGISPEEYGSKRDNWLDALHPDDRDRAVAEEVERRKSRGETFASDYRLIARDGRTIWVHDESVVTHNEDGEPLYLQGFLLDVTKRRQLEQELRQAQRMEAIGQFAAGVAHDFNNLLLAIRGFDELALLEVPEEARELRGDLEEIRNAADRAVALTGQLLAFSRRQPLQPQVIDLNDLVSGLERMLTPIVGGDVAVATRLSAEIDPVLVDPGQLEQVIVNLAINARDAMPDGGTITIETSTTAAPAATYTTISVADTGSGMDAETKANIFEPFYTTKDKDRGTGLGLATVYGIVMQSGGFIDVQSEPGQGSTFRVSLPITSRKPKKWKRENGAGRTPTTRPDETIMIVEDDAPARTFVRKVLEREGYVVREAETAEEALALVNRDPEFSLLLTNLVMPRLSGVELAQRVHTVHPEAQVLFISGYSTHSVLEKKRLLMPEVELLPKPFGAGELLRSVRAALDSPRA